MVMPEEPRARPEPVARMWLELTPSFKRYTTEFSTFTYSYSTWAVEVLWDLFMAVRMLSTPV